MSESVWACACVCDARVCRSGGRRGRRLAVGGGGAGRGRRGGRLSAGAAGAGAATRYACHQTERWWVIKDNNCDRVDFCVCTSIFSL